MVIVLLCFANYDSTMIGQQCRSYLRLQHMGSSAARSAHGHVRWRCSTRGPALHTLRRCRSWLLLCILLRDQHLQLPRLLFRGLQLRRRPTL
jgi:hypothetical protein